MTSFSNLLNKHMEYRKARRAYYKAERALGNAPKSAELDKLDNAAQLAFEAKEDAYRAYVKAFVEFTGDPADKRTAERFKDYSNQAFEHELLRLA